MGNVEDRGWKSDYEFVDVLCDCIDMSINSPREQVAYLILAKQGLGNVRTDIYRKRLELKLKEYPT